MNQNQMAVRVPSKPTIYRAGTTEVSLSVPDVRNLLIRGKPDAVNATTDQEIMLFIGLCKAYELNPWAGDVYGVKYTKKQPLATIIAKGGYMKRAERANPYRGYKAGVVVLAHDGKIDYRPGAIALPNEKLIGGWSDVYRNDRDFPAHIEVQLEEYLQYYPIWENNKIVGKEVNDMWTTKPATMIRKVAMVQAFREAFPEQFSGTYAEEEMPIPDPVEIQEIRPAMEGAVITDLEQPELPPAQQHAPVQPRQAAEVAAEIMPTPPPPEQPKADTAKPPTLHKQFAEAFKAARKAHGVTVLTSALDRAGMPQKIKDAAWTDDLKRQAMQLFEQFHQEQQAMDDPQASDPDQPPAPEPDDLQAKLKQTVKIKDRAWGREKIQHALKLLGFKADREMHAEDIADIVEILRSTGHDYPAGNLVPLSGKAKKRIGLYNETGNLDQMEFEMWCSAWNLASEGATNEVRSQD